MVTPAAKREAVLHLQALLDVSERRACRVIAADRTTIRYRSRVPNVVDDVTRECLRAVPDTSISGKRVVLELTALIAERGKPAQAPQVRMVIM